MTRGIECGPNRSRTVTKLDADTNIPQAEAWPGDKPDGKVARQRSDIGKRTTKDRKVESERLSTIGPRLLERQRARILSNC